MPSNYQQITEENITEYGQGTRHLDLLSTRYTNRTHFIFEILQNAEDANASRILFKLFGDRLEVRHNGHPFDETDVKGICGVGEGTKADDLTKIGKFGIGFKSVYVYTTAPEVHSGDENFRIDHYVRPRPIPPKNVEYPWTTLFVLVFNQEKITAETASQEIGKRLRELGTMTILFLRNIETIEYQIEYQSPKEQGVYNRRVLDTQDAMRKISVYFGNEKRENWIIFERKVLTPDNSNNVRVEIAYNLETNSADGISQITRTDVSPLCVYFPTERDTRLGFLMQGPYRTTLARDNIPSDDKWNQRLISETSELVVTSLEHLKNMDLLTISLLETLPIRESDFAGDSLFFPIFKRVSQALESEAFLPTNDNTYISVKNAALSDSEGIVRLLDSDQLRSLFGAPHLIKWVSSDISERRTPDLWRYLRSEHSIPEVDPEMFARRLSESFLSEQTDEWVIKFYKFLSTGTRPPLSIWKYPGSILRTKPILRLQDQTHSNPPQKGFPPTAYLPVGTITDTSQPIVKLEISQDKDAYEFLKTLGVQEYDIVAEVIETILPKYKEDSSTISSDEHRRDFDRIKRAYDTDSQEKKTQLRNALQDTPFIFAEKPDLDGNIYFMPDQLYFANDNLRLYFEGNPSYGFVNLDFYPPSAEALFKELGVMDSVRVEKKERNIQGYITIRSSFGDRKRGLDGFDPNIKVAGLEHALNDLTPAKSVFIWNQIAIPNADCINGTVEESTRKDFEPSTLSEEISDSFGELLIDAKWLPDADDNMHIPSEITLDDLPNSFKRNEQLAEKLGMPMSRKRIIETISQELNVPSDFLSKIIEAPPEVKAKIESFLQSSSDDDSTYVPTSQETPFPVRPPSNPESHEKRVIAALADSPDQEYVEKVRRVRTSRSSIDPKFWLEQQYKNKDEQVVCQICKEKMPFKQANGNYYFEAVEMLKGHFTKEFDQQFLALCPECSPKYKTYVKQRPEAMSSLQDNLISADNAGNFEVPVKLGEWNTSIRFVERHWLDIKAILSFYAQQLSQNVENSVPDVNQQKPQTTESSQPDKKKENWNADIMLEQSLSKPVQVVTYYGIINLTQIKCDKHYVNGYDEKNDRISIPKIEILLAFEKMNLTAVQPCIKKSTPIRNLNLLPVELHNKRLHVSDRVLAQANVSRSIVKVVTRSGNVVRGILQHFDNFVLYMLVEEKEVIVYRHGLYEFSLIEK